MEERFNILAHSICNDPICEPQSMEGDQKTFYKLAGGSTKKRKVEAEIEKIHIKFNDLDDEGNEVMNKHIETNPPFQSLPRITNRFQEELNSLFESQDNTDQNQTRNPGEEGDSPFPEEINGSPEHDDSNSKDECFFCEWYSVSEDAPPGPVKLLLEMIETMLLKGGSNMESIYNQASRHYNENVYIPAMKRGKNLPTMNKFKIKDHFENHINHNPLIFTYKSIKSGIKLRNILLNKSCYKSSENGGDEEGKVYIDSENVKLYLKVQQELRTLYQTKLSNTVFGTSNVPDFKEAGCFLNSGQKMTDLNIEQWNMY